jgi:Erv1 / Alr family
MGLPPDVWGPRLWGVLHTLCLTGTITPEFVQEFARVIPCPACSVHFKQLLEDFPFEQALDKFEWSVLLHNQVNERLGKPLFTVEQARAKWLSRPSSDFYFKIVVAILLIILVILFVRLRK